MEMHHFWEVNAMHSWQAGEWARKIGGMYNTTRPLNSHNLAVTPTISRCLSWSHVQQGSDYAISHTAQTKMRLISCV